MFINIIKALSFTFLFILNSSFLNVDNNKTTLEKTIAPPFIDVNNSWVDSTFNLMSDDERISQLFMVAAYSNKGQTHIDEIKALITDYKIGGLIFMQGGPIRQINLVNYYQSISKVPLLMSIDGEWGVSMRLDSTIRYPRQMMLGAIQDNSLIYEMGKTIANECKRVGIQVNFAPVIDVNNNPSNPIINSRSFGENKFNVAQKGYQYMLGLQDQKVLATGKHFPGHGDVSKDSHKTLPVINHSYERIDSLELYPFKQLINTGLGGIMVAHLYIPALDNTKNTATTLSPKVVTALLQDSLKYKGLIFTDALNMKGVSKYFSPGIVDVKALLAGNDVLLFSEDIPIAISEIKKSIIKGEITQQEINRRCKKILAAKYWSGLNKLDTISTKNIYEDLNSEKAKLLKRKLVENAITLVKNEGNILPLKNLDSLKIASVSFGNGKISSFQKTLSLYSDIKHISLKKKNEQNMLDVLIDGFSKKDVVIISFHNTNRSPKYNFGITKQSMKFVASLAKTTNVIIDIFANPYVLSKFKNLDKMKGIIVSYNDSEISNTLSAQLIFGGIAAKGKLPVSVSNDFSEGTGVNTQRIRLKYSIPEEVHANNNTLAQIDSIALDAIEKKAFPGCEILVAKDGIVFYQKSFGTHTYDKKREVKNNDIYDLASITKIAATTNALMKLYEEQKFDINNTLGDYLPYLDSTNKQNILIKDVLTHQAQLKSWIPFYWHTIDKKTKVLNDSIYSDKYSAEFPVKVCDNLFITKSYRDTMYADIVKSKLRDKKEYKYSDLGFYLFQDIVERLSGEKLDSFVSNNFYKPLGAITLGYKPLDRFDRDLIVPTEFDKVLRKQLVHGYVHDPGAAMIGGVAGHAGVFSNANDLAKLMQMLLQKGTYGGRKYFEKETIDLFTTAPFTKDDNRRGIGFDKPQMNYKKIGPTCHCVSAKSFGHTGFTGTMTWIDPKTNILYVFLSNRINPDQENKKILKLDVRTKIQEVINNSFEDKHNFSSNSLGK